jgi:hypothetical protein
MFGGIKDSLASSAAKAMLAGRIERYGRLLDLRIRSREKTIGAVLMLAGESEEVRIEVTRYRVVASGGEHTLVIEGIATSREWLQLLLEDFLLGQPIPVPSVATLALGGSEA